MSVAIQKMKGMLFSTAGRSAAAPASNNASSASASNQANNLLPPPFVAPPPYANPEWNLPPEEMKAKAEAGDAHCQLLLGIGHAKGWFGLEYSRPESRKWLKVTMAQTNDRRSGDCAKAFCYHYGLAGEEKKDYAGVLVAYGVSGVRDFVPAKFLWAILDYESGIVDQTDAAERPLVMQRIKRDIQECVNAGFKPAMEFLADRYMLGWGDKWDNELNDAKALELLHRACDISVNLDVGTVQTLLVAVKSQDADMTNAGAKGNEEAKLALAGLYRSGVHGVSQRLDIAEFLCRSALKQNPSAQQNLDYVLEKIQLVDAAGGIKNKK